MIKEWFEIITMFLKKAGIELKKDINNKEYSLISRKINSAVFCIISIIGLLLLPTGFNDAFLDYIKDVCSIFVGFFTTVLVFINERLDIEKTENIAQDQLPADQRSTSSDNVKRKQERNYTKRIFFGLGLNIFYSIAALAISIPNILWPDFFNFDIYQLCRLDSFMNVLHCCFIFLYRFILLMFIIKVIFFSLYSTSSLVQVLINKKVDL